MNAIAKVLVSATLGLSALAAHAASPMATAADEPRFVFLNNQAGLVPNPAFKEPAGQSMQAVKSDSARFVLSNNQAGLVPNPAYKEAAARSVDEVRREARTVKRGYYTFVNA
jgi:hypothetical protein